MDRKTLLAIGLSLLFFIGWQKYYIEPRIPKPGAAATSENEAVAVKAAGTAGATTASPAKTPAASAEAKPVVPKKFTVRSTEIVTGTGPAKIGDAGKFFTGWEITGYHVDRGQNSPPISLSGFSNLPDGEGELAFDSKEFAYANDVQGTMKASPGGATWSYEDSNLKLTREYSYGPDKKYVDLVLTAQFKTKRPNFAFVSLGTDSGGHDDTDRQLLVHQGTSLERIRLKKLSEAKDMPGAADWIAAQTRYFLFALVAADPAPRALAQGDGKNSGKISLSYPITGNSIRIPLKVYFGPKEMNSLHSVEHSLDLTIDFGWFTIFAYPLLKALKWLNRLLGNWGLAIIVLTILLKVATFPLTFKSMKNMKKMAKLTPQMNALKEKYKGDKEALNREMMTFMKENGYNPVSGCLPMIIQTPIFFAFYRVLYSAIELNQAPFFGWIQDLSAKDPLYITPLLVTALMWFNQKITPSTATDPTQAKMLQYMPVIFGLMFLNLPSGLALYMLANSIFSIFQQRYLNKKFA